MNTNNNNNYTIVKYYDNAELDKNLILSSENWKGGVFMFTHKQTGHRYIGCSHKLAKYFHNFYVEYISPYEEKQKDGSYAPKEDSSKIRKDMFHYGHSEFSLSILIYLERDKENYETNKSLYKRCLLERHKFIDLIKPEYNKFKGK